MLSSDLIWSEFSFKGRRVQNQDAYFSMVTRDLAVFAVADGMGGHQDGDKTAWAIINALKAELSVCNNFTTSYLQQLLLLKLSQINQFLYNNSQNSSIVTGSTISVICFVEKNIIVLNLGDTLIARIRNNSVAELSRLHNLAAEEYRNGHIMYEEYKKHDKRNVLTKCMGIEKNIEPHICIKEYEPKDYYFICSDGVYNFIENDDFMDELLDNQIDSNKALYTSCKNLVIKAYQNGSNDNLTFLGIKVK